VTPLCWIDLLKAQFRRAILDSQDDAEYRRRLDRPLGARDYDAPATEFSRLAEKLLSVYSASDATATLDQLQRDNRPAAPRPRLAEISTTRKRHAAHADG
jgi:ActR/RegA family two-component response regulator